MARVRMAMKSVKAVMKTAVMTMAEDRQNVRMPLKEELTPAMGEWVRMGRQMNARIVVSVLIVLNKEASAAMDH